MTLIERIRYRLRMIWLGLTLKPIAGGDGTDAPPADPPKDPPKPPADKPKDEGKTFTQADVDRVVEERLARERKKYEGHEELKAKAEKFDELEAANATELEKAQKAAEKATKERDEAVQRANQTLVRSAVVAEAAKQGAVDADAVVALLSADKVTIGDDGQVTGAEDAVKALLEEKPYLVGEGHQPPPGDGGARQPVIPPDLDTRIREAERKAREGDKEAQAEAISLKSQKLAQVKAAQQQ